MNTYDFDQTIFEPDSSCAFVLFCLRRHTGAVLKALPGAAGQGIMRLLKRAETKELKEHIFSFLKDLEDVDETVAAFWESHRSGIGDWYLKQKRDDDIIISASPEFLLRPIADELKVRLIATPMDKHTGKINGKNCHDVEKVRRFHEEYPGAHTECFTRLSFLTRLWRR